MPLNASGPISLGGSTAGQSVNLELGRAATAQISMNETAVRTLFSVASGAISMSNGYGKSNRVSVTVTLSANTTNYTLGTAQIPGYVAGSTDITLVVNTGVYVYATTTSNAGLTVSAFASGDTVSIINNGYIIGKGGWGGGWDATLVSPVPGAGGPAMNINYPVNITNNSYIAGGGGGGGSKNLGSATNPAWCGAGGGAGGGEGGRWRYKDAFIGNNVGTGAAGGGPGQEGTSNNNSRGTTNGVYVYFWYNGGGGGRILPGVGGAGGKGIESENQGLGGGAGGGGAGQNSYDDYSSTYSDGGTGGSANNPGGNAVTGQYSGSTGGGGGWGAKGGNGAGGGGSVPAEAGASGGKAVNLNGNTVTWLATGTRWGAIS